jgi:hypothetical protein
MLTVFAMCVALAQTSPDSFQLPPDVPPTAPDISDLVGTFQNMIEAFQSKNWPLAIGLLSMLLFIIVSAVGRYMDKLTSITDETRKKVLPWLVAAGGCLFAFSTALIGGLGWGQSFMAGFLVAGGAVLLRELVWKRLLSPLFAWIWAKITKKSEPAPSK